MKLGLRFSTKARSRSGYEDRADLRIVAEAFDQLPQGWRKLIGKRVPSFWPV